MSVWLLPTPGTVAVAVLSNGALSEALATWHVSAAPGWPHPQTATALRSTADYGEVAGAFLVVQDGLVHGECGWRAAPDADGDVEIGFGLAVPSRGAGRGRCAVAALVSWSSEQFGVRRVSAHTQVGNSPARHLLDALGFHLGPDVAPTRDELVRYVRDVTSLTGADH